MTTQALTVLSGIVLLLLILLLRWDFRRRHRDHGSDATHPDERAE